MFLHVFFFSFKKIPFVSDVKIWNFILYPTKKKGGQKLIVSELKCNYGPITEV